MGISHVPEGRQVFGKMSIKDNLMLGAYVLRSESEKAARLREVYELFPILRDRENQKAETLSGGEQQMLAIARGLMSNPRLLMVDEMSLGLAPFLVDRVMDTLKVIRNKVTVLLVEQKVQEALEIADRGYVLQNGRLAMEGSGAELLESDIVKKAYLGL
jgi:branched-chain amino acid transport system ATP-binding protein